MNYFSVSPVILLLVYGALVLLASLAGGWLLLAMRLTHARLQTAVSFVAGLMLAMALLHFIPHAFHQLHSLDRIVQWALGGFLAMFLLQRFFPYHHHDVGDGAPEDSGDHDEPSHHHDAAAGHVHPRHTPVELTASGFSWVATTLGMSLHSLVGGVALAAAMVADEHSQSAVLGLGTALVIILHKPFDALAVATLMAAGGCSRFSRHLINTLFALVTPLGMVLFYFGVSHFASDNPVFLGSALAFCAGTFLCIASADLLPELQFHSHDRVKLSVALLAGIGVAVLVGLLEVSGHDRHYPEPPAPTTEQGQPH